MPTRRPAITAERPVRSAIAKWRPADDHDRAIGAVVDFQKAQLTTVGGVAMHIWLKLLKFLRLSRFFLLEPSQPFRLAPRTRVIRDPPDRRQRCPKHFI